MACFVSLASTLLAGATLTLCIYLDRGLDSPLLVLIALPIMSAALALPPKHVTICGLVAFVEFGAVAFTSAHAHATAGDIAALSAYLMGTVVLSAGSALYVGPRGRRRSAGSGSPPPSVHRRTHRVSESWGVLRTSEHRD